MGWWRLFSAKLAAWRRLNRREQLLVGWAWGLLPLTDLLLRILGFRRTRDLLTRAAFPRPLSLGEDDVEEVVAAVHTAARNHLWEMKCLSRSLVACSLAAGVRDLELRIGVRREQDSFAAHAWVELRGSVVGEPVSPASRYLKLEGI